MLNRMLIILTILTGMVWSEDGQSQATDNPKIDSQNTQEAKDKEPFSIPVSILNTPIDELANEENRERHRRESAYTEKNITIQEVIAEASENIAHYTYLQLWISAASIAGLFVTVCFSGLAWEQTRRATREAQKSTEIAKAALAVTQDTAKIQLRPYITLKAMVIDIKSNGMLSVNIGIYNSGQTPAFITKVTRDIGTFITGKPPLKPEGLTDKTEIVIGPQCDYILRNGLNILPDQIQSFKDDLMRGDRIIKCEIAITYTDIFKQTYTTQFTRATELTTEGTIFVNDHSVADVST